ncbi:MAG: EAL domain-containing protein [Alkalimonas sp.]|nr:EAL domain-containing protein [Alkalimonas sp.]
MRFSLIIILLCAAFAAQAHYAQRFSFDENLEQLHLESKLYYQVTSNTLDIEEFLLNPAQHHAFSLREDLQRVQIDDSEAVWLFIRLHYTGKAPLTTILHYNFPLADQITFYQLDRRQQRLIKEHHTGSDYPFSERILPYTGFAFPLEFQPGQEIDVLFKVQDAGLVPLRLSLWQYRDFTASQSQLTLAEGVINGLLFAIALYNLFLLVRTKQLHYLYQAGFYISLTLVLATINGQAFAVLWPFHPEINSAILYVLSGITLFCLNQFTYLALSSFRQQPWRWLFYLNQAFSLLLLFSPLFADGQLRVHLLMYCSLFVLISNCFVCFAHFIQGHVKARFFALVWLCLLICGSLLMLSELGQFQFSPLIYKSLLAFIIISMTLISYYFSLSNDEREHVALPQQQKRLTNHHYQTAFQHLPGINFIVSPQGRLLSANERFCQLFAAEFSFNEASNTATPDLQSVLPEWSSLLAYQTNQTNPIETKARSKNGDLLNVLVRLQPLNDAMHGHFLLGSIELLNAQQLSYQPVPRNQQDTLTGLANRAAFITYLDSFLSGKHAGTGCVMQVTIVDFQSIQQTCDHTASNALLRQVATKLQQELPEDSLLSRLDHDQFIALLEHKETQEAFILAYRLLDVLREFRFIWQEQIFTININIGLVDIKASKLTAMPILEQADTACRLAQRKGPNRIHLYYEPLTDHPRELPDHNHWRKLIHHALQHNQFILCVQFIHSDRVSSARQYEVLLRLKGTDGNLISANNFLNVAKKAGLLYEIDRWVIEYYFSWLQQNSTHLHASDLCHINISAASIKDPNFSDYIRSQLDHYAITAEKICFEISEYVAIEFLTSTVSFIKAVQEAGCKVCLDNFGSGFSAFSFLQHLPVDFIKIDGSIIRQISNDKLSYAVTKGIIEVAQSLNIRLIAAHVESEDILHSLQGLNIQYVQGYHLSKPGLLTEAYDQQS